jgi:hypothetical protein
MSKLSELKEDKSGLLASIESKITPENIRKIMQRRVEAIEKEIAELEEDEKHPKPKPKVVSKDPLWHKPHKHEPMDDTYSEFHPTGKKTEPDDKIKVVLKNDKEYSFSRSNIPHKETGMALMRMTDESHEILISNDQMDKIVDFLKIKPVTDWLERANGDLFTVMGSEDNYAIVPHKDNVTSLDGTKPEKPKKEESPAETKDDIAECKKILEMANYDVKSKTVKTKNGKKTIKTKEPRQDRTIIADRTKSVFTTITKDYASAEDKDANKDLLDVVDAVKELMIKFMNSLDKLVANKDVDKIKKIMELLKKLVK